MNIVITGYSGFLGRHLTKRLQEYKNNNNLFLINSKVCNLENQEEVNNYFKNIPEKIDIIYHLAARTKAGDYCLHHQGDQWISNQLINTNVLHAWFRYQKCAKMVTFGTSCGYDPYIKNKTEEKYLLGLPEESLMSYAMTKRMLLTGLQSLEKQYGMKWIYFVPSTLYGPGFDVEDSHFIFDLIKKIYHGKYHNETVELWGNGNQKRELVYIDDIIGMILNGQFYENQIFNIASNKEYSIKYYAKLICYILDYDFNKIVFNKNKYTGSNSKVLSIDKIKRYNIFQNYMDIDTGIRNTINYYKQILCQKS